jgi:hypothetical protein
MPGRNTAGTHGTTDYRLGRGKAYFSLNSSGVPVAYRDLGNVVELNLTVDKETLEHLCTREGTKEVDKVTTLTRKVTISSLVLDELNFENLAMFLAGSATTAANAASTGVAVPNGNLTVTEQGRWYELYSGATGQPSSDPQGSRLYDIGSVSIEGESGTAMVEGTDYTVNSVWGLIFVIEGGAMVAGDYNVTIAANASAAATVDVVKALDSGDLVGSLKFIEENPASSNQQTEWQFHQVNLAASGDLPLIGDEWTQATLSGTAEKNVTADPDSPTVTITTFARAIE